MKKYLILFIILFVSLQSWSQKFIHDPGARSQSLGNASMTLTDFWSVQNNQAGLAYVKSISAGISYQNHFLLKETARQFIGFSFPVKSGTFGLTYEYYGYSMYSESMAGLSFGKALSDKLAAGIRIDYLNNQLAEDYGNKSWFSFEIGVLYQAGEKLSLASHLSHPLQQEVGKEALEKLPAILGFGFSYQFTSSLLLCFQVNKDSQAEADLRSGLEYYINPSFRAAIGFKTHPTSLSFGGGFSKGKLQVDVASSYHPVLGFSPHISLQYQLKKK